MSGDPIDSVRLTGVAVDGTRAFATAAGADQVVLLQPGELVGTVDDRCRNRASADSSTLLAEKQKQLGEIDRAVEALLAENPVTPDQHVRVNSSSRPSTPARPAR